MFSRMTIAAGASLIAVGADRIADGAVTLIDLGWLVLSAMLHFA